MNNSLIRSPFLMNRNDLFAPMQSAMDKFYDEFFNDFNLDFSKSSFPKLDAYESDGQWVIDVAVPGMKTENIQIEVLPEKDGYRRTVKISGKMNEEYQHKDSKRYAVRELRRSEFERYVGIPESVVDASTPEATLKNGILSLKWAIAQRAAPEKKLIEVKNLD